MDHFWRENKTDYMNVEFNGGYDVRGTHFGWRSKDTQHWKNWHIYYKLKQTSISAMLVFSASKDRSFCAFGFQSQLLGFTTVREHPKRKGFEPETTQRSCCVSSVSLLRIKQHRNPELSDTLQLTRENRLNPFEKNLRLSSKQGTGRIKRHDPIVVQICAKYHR